MIGTCGMMQRPFISCRYNLCCKNNETNPIPAIVTNWHGKSFNDLLEHIDCTRMGRLCLPAGFWIIHEPRLAIFKYYKFSDLCFHITAYRVFWWGPFFFLEMQPDLVLFTGTPLPSAWHATIYCDHNACHSVQIFSLSFFLFFGRLNACLVVLYLFQTLRFLKTWLSWALDSLFIC